jgi:site-specific recombinase XerD
MADFLDYRARLGSDFPRARFDNLRRSHATQLVLAGAHPKVAQERFWHSTVTTTLDLYSRGTAAMQEDVPAVSTLRFRML